jgi:hypothetical protein
VYDDGTNVGIGALPAGGYRLNVDSGAANEVARFKGAANGFMSLTDGTGELRLQMSSNSPYITSIGAYPMVFATNNTERMRIDPAGNVGIGTLTMFDKFNVYGSGANISVDTPTMSENNGFVIRSANTERGSLRMTANTGLMTLTAGYAGYGGILAINTNGAERMRVDTSGNVTLAKKIIPNVQSVASSATITPNADTDTQVSVTALAVPATIASPTGTSSDGQTLIIRIEDNGTARALTWTTGASGAYRAVGITLPTTTVASKVLYIGCKYNSADSRWDAVAVSQEA